MKIIPLSEGSFTIDQTKLFVPFDTTVDQLQKRPVGSLLVEIQPFVVITSRDVLLLDAGLGFEDEQGVLQLHNNLRAHGIEPSSVTKVLMSHLHKDHAGGLVVRKGDGFDWAFPKAKHYIQKEELLFAFEKGFPSYITDELELLRESGKVNLLDGDGTIDGYVDYQLTGGHCPYHQVFWINEGGERVFFGGDEAPQLFQMKSRFVAKYDFDGKRSMEWRQEWWRKGQQEHWTFLFYHDIRSAVVTL